MSINDIKLAAQRLNEAADAYHGKIADIDAQVALKKAEVETFLAVANTKFESLRLEHKVVQVLGDADKFYPLVFNDVASVNQFAIYRFVSDEAAKYGSFNGGLLFDGSYRHSSDGIFPPSLDVRWHRQSSYSPDILPATTQFVAKFVGLRGTRALPEDSFYPCFWVRGNTQYRVGSLFGDVMTCAGDGIIHGHDYGILQADYSPLLPFTE